MISVNPDILRIDGIKVQTRDGTPMNWAQLVWGDVLHVGLGLALIVDAIEDRKDCRQIVIERHPEVIAAYKGSATVVHSDFADYIPERFFDCILLDIPATDDDVIHARRLLRDCGMLLLRK